MKTQDHNEDEEIKLSLSNEFTIFKKVITDDEFKQWTKIMNSEYKSLEINFT